MQLLWMIQKGNKSVVGQSYFFLVLQLNSQLFLARLCYESFPLAVLFNPQELTHSAQLSSSILFFYIFKTLQDQILKKLDKVW